MTSSSKPLTLEEVVESWNRKRSLAIARLLGGTEIDVEEGVYLLSGKKVIFRHQLSEEEFIRVPIFYGGQMATEAWDACIGILDRTRKHLDVFELDIEECRIDDGLLKRGDLFSCVPKSLFLNKGRLLKSYRLRSSWRIICRDEGTGATMFKTSIPCGMITDRKLLELLRALACKYALDNDEIVGSFAKKRTRLHRNRLIEQADTDLSGYEVRVLVGQHQHFSARIVEEFSEVVRRAPSIQN